MFDAVGTGLGQEDKKTQKIEAAGFDDFFCRAILIGFVQHYSWMSLRGHLINDQHPKTCSESAKDKRTAVS